MAFDESNQSTTVLLCGLLCDQFVWREVAEQLVFKTNVKVIHFAGFDSIQAMATHVLKTVKGRFAVVGHSMGGRVALEVWRQAPARITAMGLFNTGVHSRRDQEIAGRLELLALAREKGMPEVAKRWLSPMVGEPQRKDKVLMTALHEMVCRHSVEQFDGQIQALLNRPDATSVLQTITVKTLLMSGSLDKWSPPQQHQEMLTQLPKGAFVELIDIGHMSISEAPTRVAELIHRELL